MIKAWLACILMCGVCLQVNATEHNNHAKLDVKELLKPSSLEQVFGHDTPVKAPLGAGKTDTALAPDSQAHSAATQEAAQEAAAADSNLASEAVLHELSSVQLAVLANKVGDILKSLDDTALSKINQQFKLKKGQEHNFDYAEVLPLLTALSLLPNDNALIYLGDLYKFGHGVPQNQAKAFACYEKAALMGNSVAMNSLGECFSYGVGCDVSLETAAKWYLEAANKGNVEAQFNMGYVYEFGEGVPLDPTQARFWYEQAAAQHHAESMFFLGQMYLDGDGVPFDEAMAKDYFGRACDLGNTDGCNLYQVMLSNNM